jgi:inner membrane protein
MDNATHSLIGWTLSRAGLNRGEKGTTVMLILAANTPDIDGLSFFTDTLTYLQVHRAYTHALIFMPLMALLPMALVKAVTRTRPTLYSWFACTLVVLSHILLDWTNVYGIRMLLPFSDRWLRLDINNLIDPIIWLILLLCLGASALVGLVSSEIGSRKSSGPRRGWAIFALLAVGAYQGYRQNSHDQALAALDARLYNGEPATHVYAFPDTFGTLRWRGLVETEEAFYEMPVDFSGSFNLSDAQVDYKAGKSRTIDAARTTRAFRVFEEFNQVPLWRLYPLVDVMRVELIDLRFGTLNRPGFKATALVQPGGGIVESNFSLGR